MVYVIGANVCAGQSVSAVEGASFTEEADAGATELPLTAGAMQLALDLAHVGFRCAALDQAVVTFFGRRSQTAFSSGARGFVGVHRDGGNLLELPAECERAAYGTAGVVSQHGGVLPNGNGGERDVLLKDSLHRACGVSDRVGLRRVTGLC